MNAVGGILIVVGVLGLVAMYPPVALIAAPVALWLWKKG